MRRLPLVLVLLSLLVLPAWAQTSNLEPLPAVPPPPPGMEAFDSALEPQVTIVRSERETKEEFRINGKLYMIKVTPAAGPAYYLVDRQGEGKFEQMDVPVPVTKPPMWVIHSW